MTTIRIVENVYSSFHKIQIQNPKGMWSRFLRIFLAAARRIFIQISHRKSQNDGSCSWIESLEISKEKNKRFQIKYLSL